MKIADSLRQEPMPEMVYSLCKLALKYDTKEELRKLLTLGNNAEQSKSQFNHVYNFSIECGFISENDKGKTLCNFKPEELQDFRHFRYRVFKSVFQESDTNFTKLARWFMTQTVPGDFYTKQSILGMNSSSDFIAQVPAEIKLDDAGNYYNGFRFWMTALGLTSLNPQAGANGTILYAAQRILTDWLEFEGELEIGAMYPFRVFFDKLVSDCPLFSECAFQNSLCTSFSMALRVLHNCGTIELIHVNDAKDVWQLDSSTYYSNLTGVTDIKYRGYHNA